MHSTAASIKPVFLGVLLIGCAAPIPSDDVNAVLPGDQPIYEPKPIDTAGPETAVVTARVRSQDEFAKQVQGEWVTCWRLVTLDVVTVERGRWCGEHVRFVAKDSWPTPESGIMVDKAPWPYRIGALFLIVMDASVLPAKVLCQQQRGPADGNASRNPS